MESAAMPVLAKHDYRDVKIVGMTTFGAFAQVDLWRCI
jgi:predicted RNA-binding protein with RPS1 domain